MFAVTVLFTLKPGKGARFRDRVAENADTSLAREPDCLRFDVVSDGARPDEVFLYELYTDAAAFDAHLGSDHFRAFDAEVAEMVASKVVRTYGDVREARDG